MAYACPRTVSHMCNSTVFLTAHVHIRIRPFIKHTCLRYKYNVLLHILTRFLDGRRRRRGGARWAL